MQTLLRSVGIAFLLCLLWQTSNCVVAQEPTGDQPYVVVLGIAQDAGYPQAGCNKACCAAAWQDRQLRRHAACLAIVDPASNQRWLVECTPDFRQQLHTLNQLVPVQASHGIDGILLTHGHIGHYAGLIHLGREVMGTTGVPVYAMPRMRTFLTNNGPWSQLVALNNIELRDLVDGQPVKLNQRVSVTPLLVPHRGEFTETVALRIAGPKQQVLFLPDIDKWEHWETEIEDVLAGVDVAYLDGTFYDGDELPGRDMSKIPHPLVSNSLARFAKLPAAQRSKIRFLHFNHTNPLLDPSSPASQAVLQAGYRIASEGEQVKL